MSSPQNIITGHSVHLNRFCYGMDFNEKYIVVPVRDPLEDDTTDDIQIFSLSTLEVVRTIKIRSPFNGKTWHLLRNLIIMGSPDETIRQFYFHISADVIIKCQFLVFGTWKLGNASELSKRTARSPAAGLFLA